MSSSVVSSIAPAAEEPATPEAPAKPPEAGTPEATAKPPELPSERQEQAVQLLVARQQRWE
jgi:hypothetical protein